MNRFWVYGLLAALAAGVGWQAFANDPNMAPGQTTLVQSVQNLFTSKPTKSVSPAAQTTPPTITAPLAPAVLSKCLQAEDEAYLRRLDVCSALRAVAEDKGDNALSRQADELERQATNLYKARTAALGIPKSKAPLPESSTAIKLEEPATPKEAANRLIAPSSPVPGASTAEIKEVKP